jgi:hypothetical protein
MTVDNVCQPHCDGETRHEFAFSAEAMHLCVVSGDCSDTSDPEYNRVGDQSSASTMSRNLIAGLAGALLAGFSIFAGATVYGDDERILPGGTLTPREVALYSATQVVVCEAPGSENHGAAGTIATDFMHGVTVAHVFYDMRLKRLHTPDECRLRVYDGAGKGLQLIRIARIRTMWDHDPRMLQSDLAMFELADRSDYIDRYFSLPARPTPVYDGERVLVVAYQHDLPPDHTKRKSWGLVYSTIGTGDQGVPNIFHTDADWVRGASGGPIYNASGALVALVQGNTSPEGNKAARRFDPKKDFNRAIRLDARFLQEYAEFVNEH